MQNRKQGKELIQQYEGYFSHLINKPISIAFDVHEDLRTVLHKVELAKIADVTNKPEMRIEGNKRYTPLLMRIACDGLNLIFVLEDIINIIVNMSGVTINMSAMPITIKSAE